MPKIAQVSWKKLTKFFEKEGFIFKGQKGTHLIYTKTGIPRPVVIPKYKQIPIFVIKNNLRAANIPRKKYLLLINKI